MSGKPRPMWHADKEGRCHEGCEQYVKEWASACRIVNGLPWGGLMSNLVAQGAPCPFAVLSDVLCLKPHEEKPAIEGGWCSTCAFEMVQDTRCIGCFGQRWVQGAPKDRLGQCQDCDRKMKRKCAPPLNGGPCLDRKEEEHRCGTCENRNNSVASGEFAACKAPSVVGAFALDGPPWPNCRFWRKR